jgi:hypothetical protein
MASELEDAFRVFAYDGKKFVATGHIRKGDMPRFFLASGFPNYKISINLYFVLAVNLTFLFCRTFESALIYIYIGYLRSS